MPWVLCFSRVITQLEKVTLFTARDATSVVTASPVLMLRCAAHAQAQGRTIPMANTADRQTMAAHASNVMNYQVAAGTLLRMQNAFCGCRVTRWDNRDAVVPVGDDLDTRERGAHEYLQAHCAAADRTEGLWWRTESTML